MDKTSFYRQTWVEIDLSAVGRNYRTLKKVLPEGTKMMVAVKANAYGHGIVEVSRKLVACGADYLGVACLDEALTLRKNLIHAPILNLGAFLKSDVAVLIDNDVTATVTDYPMAVELNKVAGALKKKAKIHVKIDTGMGRLGVWHSEADDFILKLCALPHLSIEGLYTHFPSADTDEAFTRSQITMFCALVTKLEIKGVKIPLKHSANTMAVVGYKDAHFNLVRPGLAVYGLHPTQALIGKVDLTPVMSFKTRIVYLKDVARGRSISYGRTHITKSDTVIATLPVGYGDGYNRQLSNKGRVLVNGEFCPVVGVVCMDQTMIDVGHLKGRQQVPRLEDEVVLAGTQKGKIIRMEEIAHLCRTIPYEVVCWISPRVPRVYIDKE
ncbi:MAG: alanine racemase [Candidatus Omnitrophota bacterium]|jgi:alanine racemase|nr:alanine racemase [Candidatus Omnitrophota bacterium]